MINKSVLLLGMVLPLFIACSGGKATDETEMSYTSAGVLTEDSDLGKMPEYDTLAPGTSQRIERSFENAPPMIPHSMKGFPEIAKDNNICLSCHMPDKAKAVKAIPLPDTHFSSVRPKMVEKDGILVMETEGTNLVVKKSNFPNFAYFNCTQCHAPQAKVTVDIQNLFTPEFRNQLSKDHSTLVNQLKEGI